MKGMKIAPSPQKATHVKNVLLYRSMGSVAFSVESCTEVYTAVVIPMATEEPSRVTTFAIPPASDCCWGGSDCMTYICEH